MADAFSVKLSHAKAPFVIALDVGSTASRGGLFDATARPILGTRMKVDHDFTTSPDGRSEISPDTIVDNVAAILDAIVTPKVAGRIAAVGLDTFSSAVVGVDEGGAITPCYTYADSRPRFEVASLRRSTDEAALQHRTGTRLHSSYLPSRLNWLRRLDPDTFDLADTWMSLGEYIYLQLLGVRGVSMSSAAWTGLLNRHTGDWDHETIELAGITPGHLSPILPSTETFTLTRPADRERWPGLKGALWIPAIPDGLASTLGPGSHSRTVTLGSSTSGAMRILVDGVPESVPDGLWAYRVHEDRTLVGGALNDVGRVVSWLDSTLSVPPKSVRESWMQGRPNPASPIVLPFLTGERSTGWRSDARAFICDMSESADAAAIYRGGIEGIAMTYRRVAAQLSEVTDGIDTIIATGGITQSFPSWLNVLANVLGMPVTPKAMKRSTLRGTALLALDHVAPEVARAKHPSADPVKPNRAWVTEYNARYERFCELYDMLFGD